MRKNSWSAVLFAGGLLLPAIFLVSQPVQPERVGPRAGGGFLLNWGCYDLDFFMDITNWKVEPKVWAFLGDGESDEPESLGAITLAARENLDNIIWVVNCNLQRLDGPVRGNGKIIQELEGLFRGAGWNVI